MTGFQGRTPENGKNGIGVTSIAFRERRTQLDVPDEELTTVDLSDNK